MARFCCPQPVISRMPSGLAITLFACLLPAVVLNAQTGRRPATAQPPGGPSTADQQNQNIQILAVVNGQQITRAQLAKESVRRFGETVLESMINNQLINEECRRQGIKVTDQDITQELTRRAKKFGMSIERYIDLIRKERDVSVHKLKNEIVWTELALRRLAASQIQVTEEEIQAGMDSEFGPKVQVRVIALADPQKAEKVLAQAQANPHQFSRLAIDHSVDPNSASVGGLLPPLRRNMGEPELERAAFGLKVGQVSGIVPIANQFVILKCERHYPATQLPPQQVVLQKQRIGDQIRESKLGDAAANLFQHMQETSQIVNVYNNEQLRSQMPGVAAVVNDQQIRLDRVYEECITRYGRDVLDSEINRTLILQQLQQVGKQVTNQDVQQEIGRAAVAYGVVKKDGSPDIDKWVAYVTQNDASKIEIYIQDEVWPTAAMKKLVSDTVQVTEEDMQKGFQANFGPRVQVLAIVLQDQRTAQKVWQMAKANQNEKYFGELAHQYSVEPASRANYGEVPPIQMHGGRPMLEEEAFRLQPGQISGLIPVGENWVVLWCKGRTTPVVQEFDAVKDELRNDIMEKKLRVAMANEFEQLRASAQIDNFLAGTSQSNTAPLRTARQNGQANPAATNRDASKGAGPRNAPKR